MDGAAVGFGDLAGDGEAKASSVLRTRGVRPVEALEDQGQFVLSYTHAVVRHFQFHAIATPPYPDGYGPAFRRVLDGVVEQYGSDLEDTSPVESGNDPPVWRNKFDRKSAACVVPGCLECLFRDRKSTRLNSSHANISYAVF